MNEYVVCVKVEHETAESMQTLLKLDAIKARMKAASDALRVGALSFTASPSNLLKIFIYFFLSKVRYICSDILLIINMSVASNNNNTVYTRV